MIDRAVRPDASQPASEPHHDAGFLPWVLCVLIGAGLAAGRSYLTFSANALVGRTWPLSQVLAEYAGGILFWGGVWGAIGWTVQQLLQPRAGRGAAIAKGLGLALLPILAGLALGLFPGLLSR